MKAILNLMAVGLALVSFAIPPPYGMMPAGMSLGMCIVLLATRNTIDPLTRVKGPCQ
jgi:hypothetical protein